MINKKFLLRLILFVACGMVLTALLFFLQLRSIESANKKLDLIKKGMCEREVIELLGKPKISTWMENNHVDLDLSKELKERYKKVYVLYYEFKTFTNKVFLDRLATSPAVVYTFIVFDKEKGKVIKETGRSIGDIGMLQFRVSHSNKE